LPGLFELYPKDAVSMSGKPCPFSTQPPSPVARRYCLALYTTAASVAANRIRSPPGRYGGQPATQT